MAILSLLSSFSDMITDLTADEERNFYPIDVEVQKAWAVHSGEGGLFAGRSMGNGRMRNEYATESEKEAGT